MTGLGGETTKGRPCLSQWFKLDRENAQQFSPSLFVIDYLIKVEQGSQIPAVICWDQCLETTLNVKVGRLGVCCGAETQEPKADGHHGPGEGRSGGGP